MIKKKINFILSLLLTSIMFVAAALPFVGVELEVDATSATTYTRTRNADGELIRSQDGYLPQSTYDRIGLVNPQDMVIDVIKDEFTGEEIEYGYILNSELQANGGPFILKFRLDDVENTIERISLFGNLPYITAPSGLWIRTTTVDGITRKEMYIADPSASYTETIKATDADKALNLGDYNYKYNGLIYRIQFDKSGNNLELHNYTIIHEPTQVVSKSDYEMYELKQFTKLDNEEFDYTGYQIIPTESNFQAQKTKNSEYRVVCKVEGACEERIAPLGKYVIKTASFGQDTMFSPSKIAVDNAGNMFVASTGTSSGMIQLSYAGEFVSFFVVNTVAYDFLYQFIKNFGTKEQLSKLKDIPKAKAFSNVFIDQNNLVYSVTSEHIKPFDKYSTGGSSILEYSISSDGKESMVDSYVTNDGMIFLATKTGQVYVCAPTGQIIFFFGSSTAVSSSSSIIGFFESITSIVVDKSNNIWLIDSKTNSIQTFTPTPYTNNIFDAIVSFNNQQYDQSRSAWEQVLAVDSLSVLANDGLGKAFYYEHNYEESLQYFAVSKNRTLYSNVFWELRNDFFTTNLEIIIIIAIAVIGVLILLIYLFKHNKHLKKIKEKVGTVKEKRFFKDLTVGFRLIVKPGDTFYELKVGRRGSVLGATIHYILAIIIFTLNVYCYNLPFQFTTTNQLNPSTVMAAMIILLGVFILCNYLVSAINDGEGRFKDIYKFTGYSLLPMIICLPIAMAISYGLTLNEQVVLTILKAIAFWGSGILLVMGILETHNYTFRKTLVNIILTIIFMILFLIICVVVIVMLDQIKTFIEQVWREVKLRAGWY